MTNPQLSTAHLNGTPYRRETIEALRTRMQRARDDEQFRDFEELKLSSKSEDYDIRCRLGQKNILCAAWHGGEIERGSEKLAEAIAGDEFHYYAFIAHLKTASLDSPHPFRITSSRFNEPLLLSLAQKSDTVVGIHGCSTIKGSERIFVGGRDQKLTRSFIDHLRHHGYQAGADYVFPGTHPNNPCNRGVRPGIQIEVPQDYLQWLVELKNCGELDRLALTIRQFLRALPASKWRE